MWLTLQIIMFMEGLWMVSPDACLLLGLGYNGKWQIGTGMFLTTLCM